MQQTKEAHAVKQKELEEKVIEKVAEAAIVEPDYYKEPEATVMP